MKAGPIAAAPAGDDSEPLTLKTAYPVSDPVRSLQSLSSDIKAAGGKAALCVTRFGLKDGSSLSRHIKALKTAVDELVPA